MTPDELFAYADRFARRAERADRGTQYPTVRRCAKRFRVTYAEVEQAVDDYSGDGYIGLAVAVAIPGVGASHRRPLGEQEVEAYR